MYERYLLYIYDIHYIIYMTSHILSDVHVC